MTFNIILTMILLTLANPVFAESLAVEHQKILTPDERAFELTEYYSNSELTEYKSPKDFYVVMKRLRFPNLESGRHGTAFKGIDFKNPQNIETIQEKLKELSDARTEAIRNGTIVLDGAEYKSKSHQQKAQKLAESKELFREMERFRKEVFYNFFKNELEKKPDSKITVCFYIDEIELGLLLSDSGPIPRREQEKIKNKVIDDLFTSLDFTQSSLDSLNTDPALISCDATVDVNLNELDSLYNSQMVSYFLSLDQAPANYF